MMKTIACSSLGILVFISAEAMGACSGTQVTDAGVVTETAAVTFPALDNKNSVTVAGRTYTAQGSNTSVQVAQSYGTGVAQKGAFAGSLVGWTAGPASASTVTFTSTTAGNVPNITVSGIPNPPTVVTSDGTDSSTGALTDLLTGNTVCVASGGGWEAQEFHQSGGALIDWKQGSPHPIDPTKQVGNWTITGTGADTRINYDYGGTVSSKTVWDNGDGTYSFCNQLGNETIGTIKIGQVACTP